LFGNKLVASGLYREVILIPAGIGGTSIHQWAAGGKLNKMLLDVVDSAAPFYQITHVLWHQGEADYIFRTREEAYIADFHSIVASLKTHGVTASVYVSVTSFELMVRSN